MLNNMFFIKLFYLHILNKMNMKKIIIFIALLINVNLGKGKVDEKSTSIKPNEIMIEMETPLLLESWMINDSIWYYNNNKLIDIEKENPMLIEDWMLNSDFFID